jgi:dipeptidyl aminopeptidase/acylaminoacyl peptidase
MMHGSGPASRYEFQPLTEFFASFGVASLAYDKRGSGGSGGQWQSATFQELVEDALTGVAYLQSRSDITSAQIGMWGISQGGWLVALAASQSEDIDFAISVSGPGVNPTQQEIWRVEHVLSADGFPPSVIKTALALKQRALWAWQYDGAQWNDFLVSLAQVKDESWFSYLGFTAHPHKDDLREPEFEPLPVLERISCPVLAIFGELDPYLPVKQSALDFEQALKTGENPDCTVQIIPEGNHILFRAATGGMREQPALPGFVPGYLSSMRDWLLSHVAIQRPE